MLDEVIKTDKECLTCKRHLIPVNHRAQALKVTGMFDRIGVDLVYWLPEAKDGYIVITEYLSKYTWATPIKSKTADEIAEKLWHFISLFGPPKVILSDQGKEFNNSLVNRVVNGDGAVHRITSAYNYKSI